MTNKEIQSAYKARQRKAGLVYVSEWIPQATKKLHKEYCKSLRDNQKETV